MPPRIGILGGTFDPPHHAHLILAQHALEELSLDKVLFVPAGVPPHKTTTRTPIEHRLKMILMCIEDVPQFELSRVEIDRPGPHYTIDTVRIIQAQNPDAELFFIMGGDVFRDLPNWDRPQEMFRTCKIAVAVMRRPGFGNPELRLDMHRNTIPEVEQNALLLSSPLVEFSSTDIVERLTKGKSIRYMVPDYILRYIEAHGLYKGLK
ncbi:MAG: nicotinate-nucleotide adenylyltransferase [Anaerolineae bacterium]|jgi:nicotinate-nucleotide adenylyltransferase|nr:nicotinate-nucleotide adenylyltransferase [Anaerolineae bacterium]